GPPGLAVDLEGVVARLRAEDDAAAGPDRRADRAGAGPAGALLPPRLGAATAHPGAREGGGRTLAARVELGPHGLVHERLVEARAERVGVKLDAGTGLVDPGRVSHPCAPPRCRRGGRGPTPARAAGCPGQSPRRPRARAG